MRWLPRAMKAIAGILVFVAVLALVQPLEVSIHGQGAYDLHDFWGWWFTATAAAVVSWLFLHSAKKLERR